MGPGWIVRARRSGILGSTHLRSWDMLRGGEQPGGQGGRRKGMKHGPFLGGDQGLEALAHAPHLVDEVVAGDRRVAGFATVHPTPRGFVTTAQAL